MKFSARLLTLLAFAAAALTGCRPEEADIALPHIKVSGPDLVFNEDTRQASCAVDMSLTTMQLTVTANRDWEGEIDWDTDEIPWVAITPDHGLASDQPQRVTLTILNNAGYNRNKKLKFSIGYDYKTIALSQVGERGEEVIGTLDNPLTVAGAIKYVKKLGADVQSSSQVFVKGKVSRIDDGNSFAASGTYGNATFYISDDGGTSSEMFYCYRVLYLGNKKWSSSTDTDIKVGDEVIVCGNVVNYKGLTPETVQGTAYIYSHNGVNRGQGEGGTDGPEGDPTGTGTAADPYNVAAARAAVKNLTWTSNTEYQKTETVYVKGKISRIADNGTFGQSGTFGNATFYISDDGNSSNELYCYRILYLENKKYTTGDDIKVGDEVIICGELMNYRGNTPETVANAAYLHQLNDNGGGGGGGETGEAKGSGTEADPYNPLGAAKAVEGLTWTSNTEYQTTGDVFVKGKISRIASGGTFTEGGTYGNASFYISEDGSEKDEFYCFRILYLENKKFESGQTDIQVGDDVVICGQLMNYRGNTPETVAGKAYLYKLGESGGGGGGGETGEVKAVTIKAFNEAPESDKQVYELVGTIGGSINTTYGNFDLTDETGTVYVYGLTATELGYGSKNDKSYASLGLNEGDKIKIRGYRGSYGEKIEVLNAWFIEKVTEGGGGGGGEAQAGTAEKPYTVAEALNAVKDLTWTSNTDYQATDDVYMKGKISRIPSGGTFTEGGTYGNASFYISDDGSESNEFYCFRVLYLENKKFAEGQTDIKVGDEVVICGKLMNYKGNTPETVSGKAYLYALNPGGGTPGGESSGGSSVSFATNSGTQTWAAETDGTYGAGFSATAEGLKIGYYKHTSATALNAPNANQVRIYKNSALCISSTEGKKIKKIVIGCAPNAGTSSYCFDMTGLEGGANATADKTALTVTWTGSAAKVVLQAAAGQVRMEKLTVEFE